MKRIYLDLGRVRIVRLALVYGVLVLAGAFSLESGVRAQSASPNQPFTLQELNKQLRQAVGRNTTEADLAVYIDRTGIAFDPTPEVVSRLRANGAHQNLINTIKRAAAKLAGTTAGGTLAPLGPPPTDPVIGEVRIAVRDYVDELPDFICQQVIERYYDYEGRGAWDRADTLTYELTYNRKQESYKPINAVGRPVTQPIEQLGNYSTGDFASRLVAIFEPQTQTIFKPAGKERLGSRPTLVYDFTVPKESSTLRVGIEGYPPTTPAYSGTIWIDAETKRVLRVDQAVDALPSGYPRITFETSVDYDTIRLRGIDVDFLLPIRAEYITGDRSQKKYHRNLIYFKFYRKFETDVKITEDPVPPQKP